MLIDGVTVHSSGIAPDELKLYVDYVKQRQPDVVSITVTLRDDDTVDISWTAHHSKFERIRRITGYIVGTIDRWNDSKQAEEHDRVKHNPKL